MKKFVIWLAKVTGTDITREVIVEKEKTVYIAPGEIDGDVLVRGNLVVNGNVSVTGSLTCYDK